MSNFGNAFFAALGIVIVVSGLAYDVQALFRRRKQIREAIERRLSDSTR